MIKVSLILPSLNVAQYMRECLESVVNQTLKEMEFICVDAGSEDGTLEVIREFAAKDQRVRVIMSDVKSYGRQMNIGVAAATGKYIGFVETDDFVPLNMYEELYEIAEKNSTDFVKADFYRFTSEGDKLKRIYNKLDVTERFYNRVIDPAKEKKIFRLIMNTWSGIYDRQFLLDHNVNHNETPGAAYQDNGFFFKTFCNAKRCYFVNKPYYMNRRDNPNSSMFNPNFAPRMIAEYDYIYDWLKSDERIFKTFIDVYALKRFHNLQTAYNNTPEDSRAEFTHTMEAQMKDVLNQSGARNAFTLFEKSLLRKLCFSNNPEKYYERDLRKFKPFNSPFQRFSWLVYEGYTAARKRRKWSKAAHVSLVTKEASMLA